MVSHIPLYPHDILILVGYTPMSGQKRIRKFPSAYPVSLSSFIYKVMPPSCAITIFYPHEIGGYPHYNPSGKLTVC